MRARGFTLFEVLIAVAVLGMMLVLLNQGLAFGVRATATQVRAELRQGDFDAADRALRLLVAAADPGVFPAPASLRGDARSLSMVTELPPNEAGERLAVEAELVILGDALRLRWTPRLHVERFGPRPRAQETVVLAGLADAVFAYWDGKAWQARWEGDRLPGLVRLTLRFPDQARHWPPIVMATTREAVEP